MRPGAEAGRQRPGPLPLSPDAARDPQTTRPPIFRNRNKRFWITLIAGVVPVAFYLPSLVAFRYTAAPQNTAFAPTSGAAGR